MAELERSMGCSTCRCTGFRPILDTVKSYAVDASPELCQRVKDIEELSLCCKIKADQESKSSKKRIGSDSQKTDNVLVSKVRTDDTISIDFGKSKFYKVFDVDEIFEVWYNNGVHSYMLIDGNTAKGKDLL